MGQREEELRMLSDQVLDSLKGLPQDGQERQVTISVGGDNHGSIHVGSVVNITSAPPRKRELHEMESRELAGIRRDLQSKSKDAKWRCYFNAPVILLFGLMFLAFGFALWNIYLLYNYGAKASLLVLDEKTFFIYLSWALAVTFSGKRMDKIRKVENRIIQENQLTIDAIDVILRRRSF
ncbi:hypothetical protein A6548_003696 [Salmonella enterica subsp. enterica serovar Apapa]|uniref:hypothetical protein n=1 Tax=Salmonella enterica TaxID=28901 RepID=UPI000973ACC8|nr:hypothetical protein [Salmonella enterica]EBG2476965.1 hypothetical protein [Salmonella enterica subsp. enterica serovar Lattenkamp]EDV3563967.1 hypothetical protein [Salmonella enterica subsp. enterica]EDX4213180.1 hypothetical protein [Salmonella enterica subsp. enterica serovar Apapa]APY32530.1 hypothetical protein LFZ5_11145 [Salmonella enterica subsp. enterica serovar Apapa str. SA20060561]EAV2732831.1 hypothetical protein [Salmonella enterica]